MPDYYGGAPNAFAGGIEFGAAQRARRIKENALNALIAQYGPQAGDPQTALQMQTMQQREQMQPYEVQAAQQNATLGDYNMSDAARIDAARRAAVGEQGVIAGDPAAQARSIELEDRDNALKLQAARRAASVLQMVKANKGDLGKAFDFVQGALPAIGIPPEKFAEIRAQILSDPDSVDEFVALLQGLPDPSKHGAMSAPISVYDKATGEFKLLQPMADGTTREIPGVASSEAVLGSERVGVSRGNLQQRSRSLTIREAEDAGFKAPPGFQIYQSEDGTIYATPQRGSLQEQESEKNTREADTLDEKFTRQLGAVTDHSEVVLGSATRALKYFQNAPDGVTMQNLRKLAPMIAGTSANNAWQALEEIKNNIKIDEIQRMRQNSPTGAAVGTASDRDMEILGGAMGRLDLARDPQEMVALLERITTSYNRLVAAARRDAAAAQQRMQSRPRRQAPGEAPLDDLLNKYAPQGGR